MEETKMPIFKSSSMHANMKKDNFVVPQASTFEICENFHLSEASQKTTVNKLVDRTPDWLDLSNEEQVEEIKAALVLQTVAEFLRKEEYITEKCVMFENGFDTNGNIVLDAFYVKQDKLQRKIKKAFSDKEAKKEKQSGSVVSFKEFKNKRGK